MPQIFSCHSSPVTITYFPLEHESARRKSMYNIHKSVIHPTTQFVHFTVTVYFCTIKIQKDNRMCYESFVENLTRAKNKGF